MNRAALGGSRPARITGLVAAVVLAGGLALTGCASQAELPPQISNDLGTLRDQLIQGKAQIQTTCNAARDVTQRPQAQIDPQVRKLLASIDSLEQLATEGRTEFNSADQRAQAYFAKWQTELQGMNDSLAMKGEARRAESMASLQELKKRAESLRQDFRPFMSSLLEVSKYLQTDTTAAGVKTVTPQINRALDREKGLMTKADAAIAQIDKMRGGK
jgi:outer membrane murein-binding lipoprotein Lpp